MKTLSSDENYWVDEYQTGNVTDSAERMILIFERKVSQKDMNITEFNMTLCWLINRTPERHHAKVNIKLAHQSSILRLLIFLGNLLQMMHMHAFFSIEFGWDRK